MDILFLDQDTAPAFLGLYHGDIATIIDEDHLSYGAVDEDGLLGLLVGRFQDMDLYIDWIYTVPERRREGIARVLVETLLSDLEERGYYMELGVICQGETQRDIFTSLGFFFNEEPAGTTFITEFDDINDLPDSRESRYYRKLNELSRTQLDAVNNALINMENEVVPVPLPLEPKDYSDNSCIYLKDKKMYAILLLQEVSEGYLDIAYAYKEEGAIVPLLTLFTKTWEEVEEEYPDDVKIRATATNKASYALLNNLAPDAEKEPVYIGYTLVA